MKKIILKTILLLCSTALFTQCPFIPSITGDPSSQYALGGSLQDNSHLEAICPAEDGGYTVAGFTFSNDENIEVNKGAGDVMVAQFDAASNPIWIKTYGGSGYDEARSICKTSDGFVFAGYTLSNDGDISGNHGGQDILVMKINLSGDIVWSKCFGGPNGENATAIRQTSDGGFIVVGFQYNGLSLNDLIVIKLTAGGEEELPTKIFGGSGYDEAYSVDEIAGGGFIIGGTSTSSDGDLTINHGDWDYWLLKLDAGLNKIWQKSYGGSGMDVGRSVLASNEGGFILAGLSESADGDITDNHGGIDAWVIKVTSDGEYEWKKSFGGSNDEYANSIYQITNNHYVIASGTNSLDGDVAMNFGGIDYWLIEANDSGDLISQRSFGGTDDEIAMGVIRTTDDGFAITGSSKSIDGDVIGNHGENDIWNIKLKAPELLEICNNVDDDCDGSIDEGVSNIYYLDYDIDGFGNPDSATTACSLPAGYVINNTDCNDDDNQVHPGAAEIADGIDNDCDGIIDPCSTPTNLATDYINVSSARFKWGAVATAVKYNIRYRVIGTNTWITKNKNAPATKITITGLPASTSYEWQVRSNCGANKSAYSPSVYFTTPSAKMAGTYVNFVPNYKMEIFPNPASEEFNLHLQADVEDYTIAQINIYSITGQLVFYSESVIVNGELNEMINAQDLSQGMHLIKIIFGENVLCNSVMITK